MTITSLLREAGIAATLGRRGLARPAILWNLVIAGWLQQCKNSVNVTPQKARSFPFVSVRVSSEDIFLRRHGSESFVNFNTLIRIFPPRSGSGMIGEVQISLDFIRGQRSIVTFRFSAGDTMMRGRIYASRGM